MELLKKFLSCFETVDVDPEDTGIQDLQIPLLISKVSEDETTVVARDKHTLLQIVKKIMSKRHTGEVEVFLDGDYIKIGVSKFFIETIRIDEMVRYSCNIVYAHVHTNV